MGMSNLNIKRNDWTTSQKKGPKKGRLSSTRLTDWKDRVTETSAAEPAGTSDGDFATPVSKCQSVAGDTHHQ
jgi:hypothetical protein